MPHEPEVGVTLGDLQRGGVGGRIVGPMEQRVFGVQHDSRLVEAGDLFVAVPGIVHDGARFIRDAVGRGAAAVIVERPHEGDAVPQLVVEDARLALGRAAELVYGNPTRALPTIGITGTNGKTTTAYLLARAIEGASGRPAVVGTTGLSVGAREQPGFHTTPEGDDISRFAYRALADGATHLVLEVSSHGLALRRVDALTFKVAAFTNLSRDHLDFHGSFDAYGDAKARLFTELRPERAVIHIDDPFGAELAGRAPIPVVRCSRHERSAEIFATRWSTTRTGIEATIDTPEGQLRLESPMLGEHNLENLLVALGCVYALGLPLEPAICAWRDATGSPGRLERIEHPHDVAVLVDYAHTPDALERVLQTLRAVTPGRLVVVFGAGGDRDRGKRPEMGRVAAAHADLCVITSDNPRGEDPQTIIGQVAEGVAEGSLPRLDSADLAGARRGYVAVLDRREAISLAIEAALDGDTVLIAGKGHETYQIVGTTRTHFDDREEARHAIARQKGKA